MNPPEALRAPELHRLLRACLTTGEWDDSTQARAHAAWDLLRGLQPPLAVVRPSSVDSLARVVPALAEANIAMVPRGAGMSYSAGAICDRPGWVAVDLTGLTDVLEVSSIDRVVRVQAGCTWAALHDRLSGDELRTPFWGPASGLLATIGGTLAQNAMFFGSAAHGTARESVLGVTAVLADGRLLRTGIHHGDRRAALVSGVDLTDLFVGTCGAFGIIVEATLRVIEAPRALACVGFECPDLASGAEALARIAGEIHLSEAVLIGPGPVAAGAAAPSGRADRAAAPGMQAASHVLSIAVESATEAQTALARARLIELCTRSGVREVDEGLLPGMRAQPFPPMTMLRGADATRWVPVHGIVPHSKVTDAVTAMEACMAEHAHLAEDIGLSWSYVCALVGAGSVLVEANFYWQGESNPLIDACLGAPDQQRQGAAAAADTGDIARLSELRTAMAAALAGTAAVHLQLGRDYPYLGALDDTQRAVLHGCKRLLDPRHVMNPGALGFDATQAGAA